MFEAKDILYALAKQLATAHTVSSRYGDIELDDELNAAVDLALREILERRLSELDDFGGEQ